MFKYRFSSFGKHLEIFKPVNDKKDMMLMKKHLAVPASDWKYIVAANNKWEMLIK